MSALPPKEDIGTQSGNVRFVRKVDICSATNRMSPNGMIPAVLRPRQQSKRATSAEDKERAMADAPTNSRHANRSSQSPGDMCAL
jgi:hypothetical protein